MKRIAVIYASEGTGHRAAAAALREWFMAENAFGEVFYADLLDYLPDTLRRIMSDGYLLMVRKAPRLWGWFYNSSDRSSLSSWLFEKIHEGLCSRYLPRLEEDLRKFNPDAVFFTHYFCAAPIAARNAGKFPTFCVDTDFLTHRFQRRPEFAASFAASPDAVRQRAEEGVENVFCTGIPVLRKFAERVTKEAARAALGIDEAAVVILLTGGGIGAGSLEKSLGMLAEKRGWLSVVICGSNKKLYARLRRKYPQYPNVRVEAFVPDMEDYYAAADVVVMKPGGLSLSEVMSFGRPLLLIDPIPGQEEVNLDYAVNGGAALYLRRTEKITNVIRSLLSDRDRRAEMEEASRRLARPRAAADILEIAGRIRRDYRPANPENE